MLLEPCWTARSNQQRIVTMLLLACAFPFSLPQNPWTTYIFRTCNFHMFLRPKTPYPRPYRNFSTPLLIWGLHFPCGFPRWPCRKLGPCAGVSWRLLPQVAANCASRGGRTAEVRHYDAGILVKTPLMFTMIWNSGSPTMVGWESIIVGFLWFLNCFLLPYTDLFRGQVPMELPDEKMFW